jgi:hypothetical protein
MCQTGVVQEGSSKDALPLFKGGFSLSRNGGGVGLCTIAFFTLQYRHSRISNDSSDVVTGNAGFGLILSGSPVHYSRFAQIWTGFKDCSKLSA